MSNYTEEEWTATMARAESECPSPTHCILEGKNQFDEPVREFIPLRPMPLPMSDAELELAKFKHTAAALDRVYEAMFGTSCKEGGKL